MIVLSILMLLIYIVISFLTILTVRSKIFDIARWVSGLAFLICMLAFSSSIEGIDFWLIFALFLCLVLIVEITVFKESKGDNFNIFINYVFTMIMILLLIIMLTTF